MLLTVNVAYAHWLPLPRRLCNGETENASTENVSRRDGIRKYGKPKYEVVRVENVSTVSYTHLTLPTKRIV